MPFADFENWDACIEVQTSKGHSKESAEKICGEIKHRTEGAQKQVRDPSAVCGSLWFNGTDAQRAAFGSGTEGRSKDEKPPSKWWDDCMDKITKGFDCPYCMQILKSADGDFIIYGPASVEVVDKQEDKIRAEGLEFALPQLLKRGRLSLQHSDILIGEILPEYQNEGKIYKTSVFNKQLMVVGRIWDDTKAARMTRELILAKKLRSFSISGEVLKANRTCDNDGCYRDISKLDLHAVTVCEKGINPEAHFEIIQKELIRKYITNALDNKNNKKEAVMETEKIQKQNNQEVPPPKEEEPKKPIEVKPGTELGELKDMMAKMLAMMEKMLGGTGTETAKAEAKLNSVVTELQKKVALQEDLIKKLQSGTSVQTPKPELAKTDLQDETKLRKFSSIREIESEFPRGVR